MKVVVIAGIPGSGSTTVLDHALENLDYINVNYGDAMLQIAQEGDESVTLMLSDMGQGVPFRPGSARSGCRFRPGTGCGPWHPG